MSRWYLDTSSAFKLLAVEAESAALSLRVDHDAPELVSSLLLETELRRAAGREPALTQSDVSSFLSAVALSEISPAIFRSAGLLEGSRLRSLDAIHLAAALAIGVEYLVTYDVRMAEAAVAVGLEVLAPA